MNPKQSWTFSMNARCPKCSEKVRFNGTFDQHPTEIIMDAVFGLLGLAAGLPLLLMDFHDVLRITGASLSILGVWNIMVLITRSIHLRISTKNSSRWPPDQDKPQDEPRQATKQ